MNLAYFGFVALLLSTVTFAAELSDVIQCNSQGDCGDGTCEIGFKWNETLTINRCVCDDGFIHYEDQPCSYEKKSKLTAFLISFFLGEFGGDWFYLSDGSGSYIAGGIFKLLTLGGLGIWWFVDWIRILADTFYDGNGIELAGW